MSIRDAARIAALEARVTELVVRLEQLERGQLAKVENDARPRAIAVIRKGKR